MPTFPDYWNLWAPHWATLENNFFELDSLAAVMDGIVPPVLIVGAGQGLIVEELRARGLEADGLDLSQEMATYARQRRGIELITADASDMPIEDGRYRTTISASGVIDFIESDEQVRAIVDEMRRVTAPSGHLFVAFWAFSPAAEARNRQMGILQGNHFQLKDTMRFFASMPDMEDGADLPTPVGTEKELAMGAAYLDIFRKTVDRDALVEVCPDTQYYRTAPEIRALFERLATPLKGLVRSDTCYIAQVQ